MFTGTYYTVAINNKNIMDFGAVLINSNIDNPKLETLGGYWNKNSLTPIYSDKKNTYKKLFIEMILEGSQEEIEINIAKISIECEVCILCFSHKDLLYKCQIDSINESEKLSRRAFKVKFNLIVCEIYKNDTVINIPNNTESIIDNKGISLTPCIVEITPISDIIDITLDGLADDPIIIKNLKGNKKVVLDGELQTVTVDGINKYGDTDMWDFPRLKPGNNLIKISRNSCDITIKYKPRFI